MYDAERVKANREYLLSRGRCPGCGGARPVVPNGKMCFQCMERNNASHRRLAKSRREQGVCTRCGGPLADDGCITCPKCREYNRQYLARKHDADIARYYELKRRGLCVTCGRTWAEPGHVRCKACAADILRQSTASDPDGEKRRKRRENRVAAGLCIDCGRPTKDGKQRCERCIEMRRDSTRKYKIMQKIDREAEKARNHGKGQVQAQHHDQPGNAAHGGTRAQP